MTTEEENNYSAHFSAAQLTKYEPMESKNNQQHGQGNGFLLGVIVGVILTLLFTTKRGRAIFKDAVEQGTEKFANLEKILRESEIGTRLEEEGNDFVKSEPIKEVRETVKEKKEQVEEKVAEVKEEVQQQTKQVKEAIVASAPVEKKEEKKDASASSAQEKEKPAKTVQGKRWFRGLRKKS